MKRFLAALSLLAVVASGPAPASALLWPSPTKLLVDVSSLAGVSGLTDPGQLVEMTVTSPGGGVKVIRRAVTDGSGNFSFGHGSTGARIYPGDTLTFVLAESPTFTYSAVFTRLRVTGFNLAAGTISGRVTPRQSRVIVAVEGLRVVPDAVNVAKSEAAGWVTPPPGKKTAPDGRFSVKPAMVSPSWAGTLRRGDQYELQVLVPLAGGDTNFGLTVSEAGRVPGLFQGVIGTTIAALSGPMPHPYRATLVSRSGRLKGSAAATLGITGPIGILDFRKADGRPGVIAPGDRIQVAGLGGFSQVVPRIRGVVDTAANNVTVFAPPKSFVNVSFTLFDDAGVPISPGPDVAWVKTDAAGKSVIGPGGGFTLRGGDRVTLIHVDSAGCMWFAENPAQP